MHCIDNIVAVACSVDVMLQRCGDDCGLVHKSPTLERLTQDMPRKALDELSGVGRERSQAQCKEVSCD